MSQAYSYVGALLGDRVGFAESGVKFQRCWFYHLPSASFNTRLFPSLLRLWAVSSISCVLHDNGGFRFSLDRVHVVTNTLPSLRLFI